MPPTTQDTKAPAQATELATASRIPELVEAVRLDRYVPSSDAYQARVVNSSFGISLAGLAMLHEEGVVKLNYSERPSDLRNTVEVREISEDLAREIASWKVEARTRPEELEHIIQQLRRLGIEAIGVYSSESGKIADAQHAWICAANYEDLRLITAAPPRTANTEIFVFDGVLPSLADAVAPTGSRRSRPAKTEAA